MNGFRDDSLWNKSRCNPYNIISSQYMGKCDFELSVLPLENPRINRAVNLVNNTGFHGASIFLKPPYDKTTHYDFYVNGELFLEKVEIDRVLNRYILQPFDEDTIYSIYSISYAIDSDGIITHKSLASNAVVINTGTGEVQVCSYSIGGLDGRLWQLDGMLYNTCILCKE